MTQLLIGSANRDKIAELAELLKPLGIKVLSTLDLNNCPEVVENGKTIEDNAIKKATELADFSGLPTLADDTGLFVKALNGDPGVYSARYAGPGCSYADNRIKLLDSLANTDDRTAYFATACAFAIPGKLIGVVTGEVHGTITTQELGQNGFGYDSIFKADETGLTFAQMGSEQKHKISHRARSLAKIIPVISNCLGLINKEEK